MKPSPGPRSSVDTSRARRLKMGRAPALGWTLLVVSALGNLMLLVRRVLPPEMRAAPVTTVIEKSDVDSGDGQKLVGLGTFIDSGPPSAECEKALLALEAEVNALSIEIRRRLSMPRLFALGEPNPEMEQTFRPVIDRILASVHSAEPDAADRTASLYALECRDIVCQLTFVENAYSAPGAIGKALSTDPDLRNRVTALSFPQSRLTEDIATRTKISEGKVYWRVREPDADNRTDGL